MRGRVTQTTDPDSGTTVNTYDGIGQLLTTTDGRNVTLAYVYDNLGRKTDAYLTSTSGTHLANWTYDTLVNGRLTSATEFRSGNAYVTGVTGYDDAYRKLGTYITLPVAEGSALAATWTTSHTYNVDGSLATTVYPAAGGLAAETVTNSYDAHGYQLTSAGLDTYMSGAAYQPWGDVYQRTLGASGDRVQVTTDEQADTHKAKLISVGTEDQSTSGVQRSDGGQRRGRGGQGRQSRKTRQARSSGNSEGCEGYSEQLQIHGEGACL